MQSKAKPQGRIGYRIQALALAAWAPLAWSQQAGNPLNSLQIGEVTIKGLEAEMTASLARHWDWTLGYAYADATISRSNAGDQGQRVAGVVGQRSQ